MWFLDNIVEWLDNVTGYFYDAYQEVKGWIFPFYYLSSPLYLLYYAFYYLTFYFGQFNDWLDWAYDRIREILSSWDIWSVFEWWFTAAENAWNWVVNAFSNVWNIIDDWWTEARGTVIGWVNTALEYTYSLFNQVSSGLADAWEWINEFIDRLPSLDEAIDWLKNWAGRVLARIIEWGFVTALDVAGLVATAFMDREDFWAGWQDWRDNVTEFFTSPLNFLVKQIETWFWEED